MNSRLCSRDLRLARNQVGNLTIGEAALPDFPFSGRLCLEARQFTACDFDFRKRAVDGQFVVSWIDDEQDVALFNTGSRPERRRDIDDAPETCGTMLVTVRDSTTPLSWTRDVKVVGVGSTTLTGTRPAATFGRTDELSGFKEADNRMAEPTTATTNTSCRAPVNRSSNPVMEVPPVIGPKGWNIFL
jgi:hypothetical protein